MTRFTDRGRKIRPNVRREPGADSFSPHDPLDLWSLERQAGCYSLGMLALSPRPRRRPIPVDASPLLTLILWLLGFACLTLAAAAWLQ